MRVLLVCLVLVFSSAQAPAGKDKKTTPAKQSQPATSGVVPSSSSEGQAITTPPLRVSNQDIISHLNAVASYYRSILVPIQEVGEPSDVLYRDQAASGAADLTHSAFDAARSLAALIAKLNNNAYSQSPDSPAQQTAVGDTYRKALDGRRAEVQGRIDRLTSDKAELEKQIRSASRKDLPALQVEHERVEGELALQKMVLDTLSKIVALTQDQSKSGLSGEIDQLQQSVTQLSDARANALSKNPMQSLASVDQSGVFAQAAGLFHLLSARYTLDKRVKEIGVLKQQAEDLRKRLAEFARALTAPGARTTSTGPAGSTGDNVSAIRAQYQQLSDVFQALSTAGVAISGEVMSVNRNEANLVAWEQAVEAEYRRVFGALVWKAIAIGIAFSVVLVLSNVWQRLTFKYVHDIRLRRQVMLLRRILTGFLFSLILVFGFITQFSSLATYAGLLTAGIAVGLQTVLLCVAAYFLVLGRYGVRVGDRITVGGVTGEVVDISLVRLYLKELTNTGVGLHPTGRVAVFTNSILFQAGMPMYKQIPGTAYVWHELVIKLKPEADYEPVMKLARDAVTEAFQRYRSRIEAQQRAHTKWMDGPGTEPLEIETRLQSSDTGLQYSILFPVELANEARTDEEIVGRLLRDISKMDALKNALAAPPTVKTTIRD
ncbi:MAG TPA: hypothetical protein VE621_07085 [Bryobacteraceae bacterium]|nr:hypothetical protein [Bryobacteraceae bacterium]